MNIFSNKFINLFTIIISLILFLIINYQINISLKNYFNSEEEIEQENLIEENSTEKIEEETIEEEYNWYVEIPSIDLKAPIEETTEMDVLNTMVGHFEETALTLGNVGLAAHNKGYEKNYFENLKKVEEGDIIKYQYNEFYEEYVVDEIAIIEETDWSYLEETEENKITLITCIENEPEYRLCVQGTEKE